MNFVLTKGQAFHEFFEFKNAQGKPVALPSGAFKIILEHGGFVREYTMNHGLQRLVNRVNWTITAEETEDFVYNTLYYTLYLEDRELARGVVKVQ